jgi:hypothetical protein
MLEPRGSQQGQRLFDGKTDHVALTPLETADETTPLALHGVGAGLVERLAAGDVAAQLLVVRRS